MQGVAKQNKEGHPLSEMALFVLFGGGGGI